MENEYLTENKEAMKRGEKNFGTIVTKRIKQIVKHSRFRGVHVSPTVYVNHIEAGNVSSGWTKEQCKILYI